MIKKSYFYLFFKLYTWYESSSFKWWSDWKAAFSISILEIFIFYTFVGYLTVIIKKDLFPNNGITIATAAIILISNHFIFIQNDSWKPYVEKFNMLSKRKNLIGGIIVSAIIILVFAALIFMYYMLSQIGWNK